MRKIEEISRQKIRLLMGDGSFEEITKLTMSRMMGVDVMDVDRAMGQLVDVGLIGRCDSEGVAQ